MKVEELRIPAPWGNIAAKCYGDPRNEIAILLHGYLDNAGSFDRLMVKMPETFYYVCADLPGHGLSSNFDPSLPVHYINYLLALKVLTNYFERKSYVLIGHSFGATLSIFYAQLYPKIISKLIMLDAVYVIPVEAYYFMDNLRLAHKVYFEDQNGKGNGYEYEEIIGKIKKDRYPELEDNGPAEDIAKRMIKKTEAGKYTFTLDPLLKVIIMPSFTFDYTRIMFETHPVFCPKLMLLTKDNSYNDLNKKTLEYFKEKGFYVRYIEGGHHVHQTDPEVVLEHIVPFLLNQSAKY